MNHYQKKYLGLFNFFEEAIRLFCEDEQVKNNKELYLNLEMIQKCDFSNFSKEEKYAVLVILMKYLMPLVNMSQTDFLKANNIGLNVRTGMNHINLKFKYNYTTLNSLNNSGITGNKAKFTNGNTYRNRNSIGEDSEMKRMFKNKSDLNMMNVGGGITSKKGTFSKMHNNSVDSLPIIKNNGIFKENSGLKSRRNRNGVSFVGCSCNSFGGEFCFDKSVSESYRLRTFGKLEIQYKIRRFYGCHFLGDSRL